MSKMYPELENTDYATNEVVGIENTKEMKRIEELAIQQSYPNETLIKLSSENCKLRANEIKSKIKTLELLCTHYRKLRKRWARAGTVIRVFGTGVGSVLTIGSAVVAVVVSSGIAVPVIIPIVVGSIGAIETSISEICAFTLIKQKVRKYREKEEILNKYINRLHHFYCKATSDGKISDEELKEFTQILDDYANEFKAFNVAHDKTDFYQLKNIEKLKKKGYDEAVDESKKEILEKYKEEARLEIKKDISKLYH